MLVYFQGEASVCVIESAGVRMIDFSTFLEADKQMLQVASVKYRCHKHVQVIKRSEVFISEKVLRTNSRLGRERLEQENQEGIFN